MRGTKIYFCPSLIFYGETTELVWDISKLVFNINKIVLNTGETIAGAVFWQGGF